MRRPGIEFATLLSWHLIAGTRPDGSTRPWSDRAFALKTLSEKSVRNWRTGKNLPNAFTRIENALLGEDKDKDTKQKSVYRQHLETAYAISAKNRRGPTSTRLSDEELKAISYDELIFKLRVTDFHSKHNAQDATEGGTIGGTGDLFVSQGILSLSRAPIKLTLSKVDDLRRYSTWEIKRAIWGEPQRFDAIRSGKFYHNENQDMKTNSELNYTAMRSVVVNSSDKFKTVAREMACIVEMPAKYLNKYMESTIGVTEVVCRGAFVIKNDASHDLLVEVKSIRFNIPPDERWAKEINSLLPQGGFFHERNVALNSRIVRFDPCGTRKVVLPPSGIQEVEFICAIECDQYNYNGGTKSEMYSALVSDCIIRVSMFAALSKYLTQWIECVEIPINICGEPIGLRLKFDVLMSAESYVDPFIRNVDLLSLLSKITSIQKALDMETAEYSKKYYQALMAPFWEKSGN